MALHVNTRSALDVLVCDAEEPVEHLGPCLNAAHGAAHRSDVSRVDAPAVTSEMPGRHPDTRGLPRRHHRPAAARRSCDGPSSDHCAADGEAFQVLPTDPSRDLAAYVDALLDQPTAGETTQPHAARELETFADQALHAAEHFA